MSCFSTAAPIGDEPLTPDDAVNVLEEILEAQNQSFTLGQKLKLPLHIMNDICTTYSQPRDRLLQVLIEFTKQVDPIPTWRAIVAALRSSAVNLPQLATRVEAAHFPDPTASHEAPSPGAATPTGKHNTATTTTFLDTRLHYIATRSAVAITETSFSLTSGKRDTGSSETVTVEAAHLMDNPPTETTTSTGIYFLKITTGLLFFSIFPFPSP